MGVLTFWWITLIGTTLLDSTSFGSLFGKISLWSVGESAKNTDIDMRKVNKVLFYTFARSLLWTDLNKM